MTLNMEQWNGSSWDTVDIEAQKFTDFKLQVGYSHPTQLTFTAYQPHQDTPLDPYTPIRFWDDEGDDPGGTPFSDSNPTFLGHVEDVDPGEDGQTIRYTCLDPTARASNEIPIMSAAWSSSTAEGSGTVPRLIFNSTIDNDDDWVFCRAFNQDVGEMMTAIFDDAVLPLRRVFAAASGDDAYTAADLANLDFEPQEKVVSTSEPIRSGIMRLLNDWEPEYRMLFYPGTQKWRFIDIRSATQTTRTLNDFTEDYPILQLRLERSLEGRYTAVKIYGPEALENLDITLGGGGLNDVSTTLPLLDTYGAGGEVRGRDKWQIDDSDKRRIGRLLPTAVFAPSPEFRLGANAFTQFSTWTRSPVFLARYQTSSAGTDAWETVTGWTYDPVNGIIDFKGRYVYRYNYNPDPGDPNYENPVDVRFIYPSFIEPLSVREPDSSYEGTAFDDYDLQNELKIYDEMLAVGFLYGTPVTSATRKAKFDVLARNVLNSKKDVVYTGGMTLEGMDYAFQLLGRRVNIDGIDGDGGALTTGWESINAIVTDVEYDYEQQLTTVQFSTDQEELTARDPSQIKEALKVGAAQIQAFVQTSVQINKRRAFTEFGTPIIGTDVTITGSVTPIIVDPFLGTVDLPEFS